MEAEEEGYRVTTDERFNSTTKWCLPRNISLTRYTDVEQQTLAHPVACGSKRGEREEGGKISLLW